MRASLLVIALAACTTEDRVPQVVMHADGWSDADRRILSSTASVWADLGFWIGFERSALPPCRLGWAARGDVDCAIEVGFRQVPELAADTGADGLANRETHMIEIDAKHHGFALLAVASHELGHIMFNTGRHLAPGEVGIMAAVGAEWEVSPADLAFACELVLRGCEGGSDGP